MAAQVIRERRHVRKRRRPSGEAPPLPRKLERSGRAWLGAALGILLLLLAVAFIGNLGETLDRGESRILRAIAELRSEPLTKLMRGIDAVGSDWTVGILLWGAIVTMLVYKRFRHLFVLLACFFLVGAVNVGINHNFIRARPFGVEIIGHWSGASIPSRPMAALAMALMGVAYCVVVPGRARSRMKWVAFAILTLFASSRLYLGVDHPFDLVIGTIIGISIPVVMFRWLTPNEVFPVTYQRGKAAHLDVEGARGKAIKEALETQLGIVVVSMKPFGLAGSGGSTPLRLEVDDEDNPHLFAKLYARTHLRADRWYKLGRTLLYGRLEDETAFSTVRRLVQYEDYLLRVMRDAGLPTAKPLGFVEITPEREYLIVTEFIEGGKEILDVEVTPAIIDNALAVVRKLWDAGLAHRDIKPSNLLVAGDKVHLIDVAFGQVRPSPWREAVDLANMMLVLGLKSSPELVYERALAFFSPDEIAEAFAATRGVTIPSQSRGMLKSEQSDLLARFRELAPPRRRVSIQRWSWRRVGLTVAVLLGAFVFSSMVIENLQSVGLFGIPRASETYAAVGRPPTCDGVFNGEQAVLQAQAVPSAELLPCTNPLPEGWSLLRFDVRDGSSVLHIASDRALNEHVKVSLRESCNIGGTTQVPSDELDTDRFEKVETLRARYAGTRYYVFDGGCVTYEFDFSGEGRTALAEQASQILSFRTKTEVAQSVEERSGINPFEL